MAVVPCPEDEKTDSWPKFLVGHNVTWKVHELAQQRGSGVLSLPELRHFQLPNRQLTTRRGSGEFRSFRFQLTDWITFVLKLFFILDISWPISGNNSFIPKALGQFASHPNWPAFVAQSTVPKFPNGQRFMILESIKNLSWIPMDEHKNRSGLPKTLCDVTWVQC